MKESLLQIKEVSIGYGAGSREKVVAAGLEANMLKGELVCLLGANGTGKSTLMRSLCGFQPTLAGEVLIDNREVNQLSEKELSRYIAVVLTDRVVVPNASVQELVGYGRSPYTGMLGRLNQEDHELVEKAMRQCGIAHKKDSLLSALSDGERQKAFIAKAIAQDTPLIVLDEPTAFLDLPARVEIMQLLRDIANRSGKAILMSTHDLDLALQLADRLWLLHPQGPILTGSPEDLLLQNAFQSMFQHKDIVFDNKTGLFQVNHQQHSTLAVKGHGFEYVLLRRAFSRKGIRLVKFTPESDYWIEVSNDCDNPFAFFLNGECVCQLDSVEEMVAKVIEMSNLLCRGQEVKLEAALL